MSSYQPTIFREIQIPNHQEPCEYINRSTVEMYKKPNIGIFVIIYIFSSLQKFMKKVAIMKHCDHEGKKL